jgi:hypothetical protein
MCVAKNYIDKFIDSVEGAMEDYNNKKDELKKVEGELLDIMHFIENENCNVLQGYYYFKAFKMLRNRRRILKNELKTLEILNNTLSKTVKIDFYKSIKENILEEEKKLLRLKNDKIYNTRKLHNVDKNNIKEFCNNLEGN